MTLSPITAVPDDGSGRQGLPTSERSDLHVDEPQHTRFMNERLMPIVSEVMGDGSDQARPQESTYELHDLVTA